MSELTAHEMKLISAHPKILTSKVSPDLEHFHIKMSKRSPHLRFLHMTKKNSMDNVRGVHNKYQVGFVFFFPNTEPLAGAFPKFALIKGLRK